MTTKNNNGNGNGNGNGDITITIKADSFRAKVYNFTGIVDSFINSDETKKLKSAATDLAVSGADAAVKSIRKTSVSLLEKLAAVANAAAVAVKEETPAQERARLKARLEALDALDAEASEEE